MMGRSAGRRTLKAASSIGIGAGRRGRAFGVLAAMAVCMAGCGAGPLSVIDARAIDSSLAAALPSCADLSALVAADTASKEKAPSNSLVVGFGVIPFVGFNSIMSVDAALPPFSMDPAVNLYYDTVFEDGSDVSLAWVLKGPATGAAAIGDSYTMLTLNWQYFRGDVIDSLKLWGLWVDVKTMMNKPGSRGRFKPYVRYGMGVVSSSEVEDVFKASTLAGLRAGLGVEFSLLGLRLFLDAGPQVVSAPAAAGTDGVGNAEPMFAVPVRVGLVLSF
jgi:hypothetical protein